MSDDPTNRPPLAELEALTFALHELAFAPKQPEFATAPTLAPSTTTGYAPQLAAPAPRAAMPAPMRSGPNRPVVPVLSQAQSPKQKSASRRFGRALVSISVTAAVVGGGYLGVRALLGSKEDAPRVASKDIPVLDTTGAPGATAVIAATYAFPDSAVLETGLVFQATHVFVDNTVGDERVVGLMGRTPTGEFYTQFAQGPQGLAGLDVSGDVHTYCSKTTGSTEQPLCWNNGGPNSSLFPQYLVDAIAKEFGNYIPLAARPFAGATFAGPEDLNGITRTRYDVLVDGAAFQAADPAGYTAWAESLHVEVVGTVHFELWIEDANRMVWKANYWADGSTNRRSVTVLSVSQGPLIKPF